MNIRWNRIIAVILIVNVVYLLLMLAQVSSAIWQWFSDCLEPIAESSENSKCLIALGIIFFIVFIITQLLLNPRDDGKNDSLSKGESDVPN